MVRGPFHRPGRRDQCRERGRRPEGGVRQLALGADEESPQSDRSVQAAGLRARGAGICQARGQLDLDSDSKPYRPNVGIALFNPFGRVLIGRRYRDDGPEIILPGFEWQMPQGGIDANENPRDALMRELWEETGVTSAAYLGETDWLTYEFPPFAEPASHRLSKFPGHRQQLFGRRCSG